LTISEKLNEDNKKMNPKENHLPPAGKAAILNEKV